MGLKQGSRKERKLLASLVFTLSYCALNSPWMRHAPRIFSLCCRDASLNVLAELEQEEDQDAVIWFCLVSLCETIMGSQLRVLWTLQFSRHGDGTIRVGPGYTTHSCLYNSSSAPKIDALFKTIFLICHKKVAKATAGKAFPRH